MNQICFKPNYLLGFIIIFTLIFVIAIVFLLVWPDKKEKSIKVVYPEQPIPKQEINLNSRSEEYPEKRYVGPRDYDAQAREVGFIYNNDSRFVLFETRRGNKYYYHTIDDSRKGIRIIIESNNNRELFDNDDINIPELSSTPFKIKLYEHVGSRYNPFVY